MAADSGGDNGGGIPANGGAQLGNGGTLPSTGGLAQDNTGGVVDSTGGAAQNTGGVAQSTGGVAQSTGGVAQDTGGTVQNTGGTEQSTGGVTQNTGGTTGEECTNILPPDQDPSVTCDDWAAWGMCDEAWFEGYCDESCGRCTSSGDGGTQNTGGTTQNTGGVTQNTGGTTSTGGTTGNVTLPDINGGSDGWASRYWDCCKPHCGWEGNVNGTPLQSCDINNQSLGGDYAAQNGCEGGPAFMCYQFAPWSVSDSVSYGFAAYNGSECGVCYHIQFTGSSHNGGNDPGSAALNGKHMIVQMINIGGIEANQFDLLIPGGGVGAMNGCSTQWGTSDLGAQYGGFLTDCASSGDRASCVLQKCQQVFGTSGREDLMAGCEWFTGWFAAADNPALVYERIDCPSAITSLSGLNG